MVMFVRLKTLWLIFGILAGSACQRQGFWDSPDAAPGSEVASGPVLDVDKFVNREHRNLKRLTRDVTETFPLRDYAYIYLGQSPTLLYAAMGYGRPGHFAIPLSGVNSNNAYFQFWLPHGTFYLRKLFDHFDIYLKPLIQGWVSNQIPPRVVTIDFCQTGESLGGFLLLFEHYLKETYNRDQAFKVWVSQRQEALPEIHFLCLLDDRLPDNHQVAKSIQEVRRRRHTFTPRTQGKMTVYHVKPGEIHGDRREPITIDTGDLLRRISLSNAVTWHGRTISGYYDQNYWGIWEAMTKQATDPYSPYGSWKISESPLEKEKPPVRPEFLELHRKITTHKGWGERLLDRLGCAPKATQ